MIVEDQSEVIAFLSDGQAYNRSGKSVERIETHANIVFLAGERAYKLKRAVTFPYLDYSTIALRQRFCEAEVSINRRTAPGLYRGVVPVSRRVDGQLQIGGTGEPVDWLVEMVRFDQDHLCDRLAASGRLDRFAMESLADEIAHFHADATIRRDGKGSSLIADILRNNEASLREIDAKILDMERVDRLSAASLNVLQNIGLHLDQRLADGRVRHCHGDLHLRNIVILDGRPVLFDAIEFSDAFANIDVLYDLAFLVMDLENRDLRVLASILLNRYLDITGDYGGLTALPLFLSMRAAVRAHVDAAAAGSHSDPHEREKLVAASSRYLHLAEWFLKPYAPRLIAVGGLSGSGKSRLSRYLAPFVGVSPGARIVRTDTTRKRLAGVAPGTRLSPAAYTPEASKRTYNSVLQEVRETLMAGQSVIADAVFALPEERAAIENVASEAGVPFDALWLEAEPERLVERVVRRRNNASDATPVVVRMQLAYDLGEICWRRLNSSSSREETLKAAMTILGLTPAPHEASPER